MTDEYLQIELVLTAATFSVAIIGSIAGIFGMNLNNKQEDSYTMFLVVGYLCRPCLDHITGAPAPPPPPSPQTKSAPYQHTHKE